MNNTLLKGCSPGSGRECLHGFQLTAQKDSSRLFAIGAAKAAGHLWRAHGCNGVPIGQTTASRAVGSLSEDVFMENLVSNILDNYERGSLSRREFIQGVTLLLTTSASAATSDTVIRVSGIHHVSICVSDLQRSVKFYRDTFGLPIFNEDKATETVRLKAGSGLLVIRRGTLAGVVDHFALGVDHLDKTEFAKELKEHGITPADTGEPLKFHVADPDGYPIQIMPTAS
jgi:catechol 2,3-dioxygenase-like lactoylglutathione lyase family enzyme